MESMRICVFGGTGFIGGRLVSQLLDAGHRVRLAARHPSESHALTTGFGRRLKSSRVDILDMDSVQRATRHSDIVINLVGAVSLPSRQAYFNLHERGARHVAEGAHASGASRLVHISALGISATAPSAADRSKAAGEVGVRSVFPEAILLRPSLVYGAGDHFLTQIDRFSRGSPVLPLIGADTRVQPVQVDDLVEGLVRLVHDPGQEGKIFQAVGPSVYALRTVVEMFLASRQRRRLVVGVPHGLARVLGLLLGCLPNPPLSRDLAELMRTDKIAEPGLPRLEGLGVRPCSLSSWLAEAEGRKAFRQQDSGGKSPGMGDKPR